MSRNKDDIFSISVTELLLIIMFALLIVMILLNATTQTKLDEQKGMVVQYEKMTLTLKEISDALGLSSEGEDQASLALTEAVAQMQALLKALKYSVESDEAAQVLAKMKLDDVWSSLAKVNNQNINIAELLATVQRTSKVLEECLKELEDTKKNLAKNEEYQKRKEQENKRLKNEIAKREEDYKELKVENSNLIGQVENLSNGLEFPPCWATADGRAQYTFIVSVKDDSLIVTSVYPAERKNAYFQMMNSNYNNSEFSLNEFTQQLDVFYKDAISRKPECRYFVKVVDETSVGAKSEYKLGLQKIESIFYKYLMN